MAAGQRKKTVKETPAAKPVNPAPVLQYNRTLKFGATGDDVKALQTALAEAGCKVTVNGVYDTLTVKAVQAIQLKKKLPANGIAGKNEIPILLI